MIRDHRSKEEETSLPSANGGFALQVTRSARNLYRAIPRDRQTLAQIHQQKYGLVKQAGPKQVARDAGKTAVNLLRAGKDLFCQR